MTRRRTAVVPSGITMNAATRVHSVEAVVPTMVELKYRWPSPKNCTKHSRLSALWVYAQPGLRVVHPRRSFEQGVVTLASLLALVDDVEARVATMRLHVRPLRGRCAAMRDPVEQLGRLQPGVPDEVLSCTRCLTGQQGHPEQNCQESHNGKAIGPVHGESPIGDVAIRSREEKQEVTCAPAVFWFEGSALEPAAMGALPHMR